MSFFDNDYGNKDVIKFFKGELPTGLGIGVPQFDEHFTFKRGELNVIVGRPNIGKTYFILFYLMCLWRKHGLKSDLYVAENKIYSVKIDLVQLYHSKKISELSEKEIYEALNHISDGFRFVNNHQNYTMDKLWKTLDLDSKSDIILVDPYNALDPDTSANQHVSDYKIAGDIRRRLDSTGKTMYINMHPTTEAQRMTHKNGDMKGFPCPIHSSYVEGGGKWPNRADNVYNLHRYTSHPEYRFQTLVTVEKVKDTKTGGRPTLFEEPIVCTFNYGSFFTIGGINPMKQDFKSMNELDIYARGINDNDIPF